MVFHVFEALYLNYWLRIEFNLENLFLPTINEIDFFPLSHVFWPWVVWRIPTEQQRRFVDFFYAFSENWIVIYM